MAQESHLKKRGGRPRTFGDASLQKLSIFVPRETAVDLRVLAVERGQTVSQVVAELIRREGEKP